MKINVGRGLIEQLVVRTTAPPNAGEAKTYGSQYYPAPSPEAIERARKNSLPNSLPRRQRADAATIRGAKGYEDGDPWPTILLEASKLDPGFSTLQPEQQEERRLTLRETIKKHITRHKIRRPKKNEQKEGHLEYLKCPLS